MTPTVPRHADFIASQRRLAKASSGLTTNRDFAGNK
jgi:hypothetical protein